MEDLKKLRELTGAGVMDCKRALEASQGDFAKAIEWLRQKGIGAAVAREGREAKEGLIAIKIEDRKAAMAELNCETDFVARTDEFAQLAQDLADKILREGEAVLEREAVADLVLELSGRVGEKMCFRRAARLEAPAGFIASYLHSNRKIGVLVAVEAPSKTEELSQWAKNVAMQIAASRPNFVSRESIPKELLERQKEFFLPEVASKPPQIQEKIIQGKMEKWFEEICLLDQPYIRNEEQKVKDYLAEIRAKTGASVAVSRFVRFELGA
jgi:elongation factor Ts